MRSRGYSGDSDGCGLVVIVDPSDIAPAGTYIAVRAGTQLTFPTGWVCVRATAGGTSVPVPGSPSGTTHTFVEFVAPGSPGYQAEPAAAPAPPRPTVGGPPTLPSTSTVARPDLVPLAVLSSGALAALLVLRRRWTRE